MIENGNNLGVKKGRGRRKGESERVSIIEVIYIYV
jgi:hypothetical protein